jgi:dTDP-4-amino-4,6-dideoxygalactose transaminase
VTRPAALGGEPAFPDGLPFVRPSPPPLDRVAARLAPSYDRGVLTNGPLVRELEEAAADRLGVPHVVAVSSCTTGLMLALQALVARGPEPRRPVAMPSFTFSATAHAAVWAGAPPRFAECDPATFLLDLPAAAAAAYGAGVLVGTHTFGAPCRPSDLEDLGRAAGVPVLFDAAHAFGATHRGRPVGGFGAVEVFSLSPTKPLVAGEGGLVATRDRALAARVRDGRDYGNPGDYDTRFAGLNGRLSELHAAVGLESLARFDEHLARRTAVADRYRAALAGVPGLALQAVDPADTSTWKDLTVAVDPARFGTGRDALVAALRAEGVDTRCYFSPPVHRQAAYRLGGAPPADLPCTDRVAGRVVSLPIWPDLPLAAVDRVAGAIAAVHDHAGELSARVDREGVACAPS